MKEPLAEAGRIQRAAARQGFDWARLADVWPKLEEEIGELRAVARHRRRAQEELGDLLFMVVNLARHLGISPSAALRAGNRKFQRRYAHVMRHSAKLPPLGSRARLIRMEELWQEAKRKENRFGAKAQRRKGKTKT
jgi:uncharacterized protein YabN with tetrapyrrole methylase and pyrophosphatase domain